MNFAHHIFIYFVVIVCKVTANFPEFLKVEMKASGSNKVVLSITKVERFESQLTLPCVLYYYPTKGGTSNEKKMTIHFFENRVFNLTITGLHPDTNYTVSAKSGNQPPVKILTLKTDSSSATTTSSGPVVEYKEKQLFSASTLDIVLGVLFGVVALCIVGVTSLYLYRRQQRRQRLQNFLRTPHTDPFESLQDYVE